MKNQSFISVFAVAAVVTVAVSFSGCGDGKSMGGDLMAQGARLDVDEIR